MRPYFFFFSTGQPLVKFLGQKQQLFVSYLYDVSSWQTLMYKVVLDWTWVFRLNQIWVDLQWKRLIRTPSAGPFDREWGRQWWPDCSQSPEQHTNQLQISSDSLCEHLASPSWRTPTRAPPSSSSWTWTCRTLRCREEGSCSSSASPACPCGSAVRSRSWFSGSPESSRHVKWPF